MSRVYDLETKLGNLESRLAQLTSYRTTENDVYKNGDVYSHETRSRVGSKEEIASVEAQIRQVKEELVEARKWEQTRAQNAKEDAKKYAGYESKQAAADIEEFGKAAYSAEERYKLREEKREQEKKEFAIADIQRKYKSGSNWQKFVATINHQKPNKKELMKLSSKELEHLYKLSTGDTRDRQQELDRLREHMKEKGYSYSQIKKAVKNSNWNTFMHYMNNPSYLESSLEVEGRRR